MIYESFRPPGELSLIPGCRSLPAFRGSSVALTVRRERARLLGCAKATGESEIIPLNRGEELGQWPSSPRGLPSVMGRLPKAPHVPNGLA